MNALVGAQGKSNLSVLKVCRTLAARDGCSDDPDDLGSAVVRAERLGRWQCDGRHVVDLELQSTAMVHA